MRGHRERRRASLVRVSPARPPLHRAGAARPRAGRARRAHDELRDVNNVNVHWQLDNRFEVGTQIGARYVESTIDGDPYSGWSTLLGLDLRRDLTRVLDVGLHGTWLDSAAGGTTERSAGFDFGVTAARNLWISIGYNFRGFRDEHFDASRYTADGPYVRFRFKADQDTFKDLDLSRLRPGNR